MDILSFAVGLAVNSQAAGNVMDILSFCIGLAVGCAVAAVLIAAAGDLVDKLQGRK